MFIGVELQTQNGFVITVKGPNFEIVRHHKSGEHCPDAALDILMFEYIQHETMSMHRTIDLNELEHAVLKQYGKTKRDIVDVFHKYLSPGQILPQIQEITCVYHLNGVAHNAGMWRNRLSAVAS